jgi:acyl-CoA hydrolase
MTGRCWPCVTAFVTFVAIDEAQRPTAIPPLAIETEAQRVLAAAAEKRRSDRLARRARARGTAV